MQAVAVVILPDCIADGTEAVGLVAEVQTGPVGVGDGDGGAPVAGGIRVFSLRVLRGQTALIYDNGIVARRQVAETIVAVFIGICRGDDRAGGRVKGDENSPESRFARVPIVVGIPVGIDFTGEVIGAGAVVAEVVGTVEVAAFSDNGCRLMRRIIRRCGERSLWVAGVRPVRASW